MRNWRCSAGHMGESLSQTLLWEAMVRAKRTSSTLYARFLWPCGCVVSRRKEQWYKFIWNSAKHISTHCLLARMFFEGLSLTSYTRVVSGVKKCSALRSRSASQRCKIRSTQCKKGWKARALFRRFPWRHIHGRKEICLVRQLGSWKLLKYKLKQSPNWRQSFTFSLWWIDIGRRQRWGDFNPSVSGTESGFGDLERFPHHQVLSPVFERLLIETITWLVTTPNLMSRLECRFTWRALCFDALESSKSPSWERKADKVKTVAVCHLPNWMLAGLWQEYTGSTSVSCCPVYEQT